ncbi:F-type H+-transporting ATPase subunit a [Ruminococcaceae bacterium YAD3003]|nr:F-type H+-transporting ATPase subunit a [Ruminococcaceae bacterium YAD3003]
MIAAFVVVSTWFSEFWAAFVEQFIERLFGHKDIGAEISEAIMQVQLSFAAGDYSIIITDAVIVTWIAVVIMLIVIALLLGKPSKDHKLTKGQTLLVSLTELVIKTAMGFGMNRKQAEEVAPMVMTFGLVLIACNSISYFHLPPPAKNVAFPVGCAIVAIIYVIVMTFKFIGIKGFWISLTQPVAIMLPFRLLDYVIKPLSLALRLFGNVFAAYVFMEFLSISLPVIVPGIVGLWFDIIDGLIQAVVFAYLTMSYIGENLETYNEYMEHPEEHQKKKKSKKSKKSEAAVA